MQIWKQALKKLKENNRVILLLVVSHKGSSPGKQGFKMIVSEDRYIFGSIGGGRTEYELVEEARRLFFKDTIIPFFQNQIHRDEDEESSGMICSGEQLVLFYPLNNDHIETIKSIIVNKSGILSITENIFKLEEQENLNSDFYFEKTGQDWIYSEKLDRKNKLYIIGGGHVGLATSKLFSMLDFHITIFESRTGINTFDKNEYVDEKFIIDYKYISDLIPEDEKTFILILTHGYNTDREILGKLLEKKYKYIGMLGSKSKVKQTFKTLQNLGYSPESMAKVDAPVGIAIGSKTPEEIAVSIAAKIISLTNS
jgi:xanthine dehydrogenase accessory factor